MGAFGRAVATMGVGTALAAAVPVLISPLLTRLFDPAELGGLALYLSVLAILAVVATGRFELALPIVRRTQEAQVLFRLCLRMATVAALIVGGAMAVLWVFPAGGLWEWPTSWAGFAWIPLGVWLLASSQALNYWANRHGRYRVMAGARVAQALVTSAGQIVGGLTIGGPGALIAASVLGQAVHGALLWRTWVELRSRRLAWPRRAFQAVFRRHRSYPLFMIPGQLANVASAHAPVILLAVFFEPAWAGYYALAERVLLVPAYVLGTAMGEVFRQHAAAEFHAHGQFRALFLRTAFRLALAGLLPLLLVLLAGPPLFSLVFGVQWARAGEVAALMAPMIFFQLVSTPLSQTVLLGHLHRADMIWQLTRLVLACAAFGTGLAAGGNAETAITLYAAALSAMYLLHTLMQFMVASGRWGCQHQVRRP